VHRAVASRSAADDLQRLISVEPYPLQTLSNHDALSSGMAMPQMLRVAATARAPQGASAAHERVVVYEGADSPRVALENVVIQATAAVKGMERTAAVPVEGEEAEEVPVDAEYEKVRDFCQRIIKTSEDIDKALANQKGQSLHVSLFPGRARADGSPGCCSMPSFQEPTLSSACMPRSRTFWTRRVPPRSGRRSRAAAPNRRFGSLTRCGPRAAALSTATFACRSQRPRTSRSPTDSETPALCLHPLSQHEMLTARRSRSQRFYDRRGRPLR
jgi:hypothetical protein